MPAFGVMGWAMPRVLCEEILARSARFLIILRQSSPRRDPERSRRDISPSLNRCTHPQLRNPPREESAFPSWRIPPFLILADALLSLRQTDSLTPQPLQGRNSDSPARKCRVSKGSRLRAPARHYTRHRTAPANQSSRAAGQSTSRTVLRMFVSGRTSRPPKPRAARQHLPAQEAVTSRECVDLKGLDWKGTPSVASLQSPSLLSFRAQRGICFSPHLLRQPQLRNQNHPLQGRNDDSPARKCRVSHGLRSCAPHAPLPRRVRPAR